MAGVEFRVLGPVEIRSNGSALPLGGANPRRIVLALLLSGDRPITVDRLVLAVWGDSPPRSAAANARSYLTRLRRVLGEAGAGDRIVRRSGGVVLQVERSEADLLRFEALVERARDARAGADLHATASSLRQGLALWRGEIDSGSLADPELQASATALNTVRLSAIEDLADALMGLERPGEAVAELRALVAVQPFREQTWARLMRALYAGGDVGAALGAYRELRTLLVGELGVEPSEQLQQLEQAVLRRDPELAGAPVQPGAVRDTGESPGGGWPAAPALVPTRPAQLPAGTAAFAGRASELRQLSELLPAGGAAAAARVAVIVGAAGIGKTALAVHWAHQVADQYPDGQLYVNLRGFGPDDAPVEPAVAVRAFLDAFEVPPRRVPVDPDALAALYRSLLAGRRVLVVLDNARDSDQVRPLLPGTPGCVAVVTSRNRLTGVVAIEGAHPLALDLLTATEARQLLSHRLHGERMAAEPEAVDEIIRRCGGLPLALAIVAAHAATRPRLPLAALAGELREPGGLDAFSRGEDPATNLRTVFSWSYRNLSAGAARLFRLLGTHPGPDISEPAAASLAGIPLRAVRPPLAELTRAHVLTEHRPGRFILHDLLHSYAAEQARGAGTAAERQRAARRMLDHYAHSARAATLALNPHQEPITLPSPDPRVVPEPLGGQGQAQTWFAAERRVLRAVVEQPGAPGLDAQVWQLARALTIYLDRQGLWHDLVAIQRAALAAATRLGDRRKLAHAHRTLGLADTRLGRHASAGRHYQAALDLLHQLGDGTGQAHLHLNLAHLAELEGHHQEGMRHARRALERYLATGDQPSQARALNSIGWFQAQLGDHRAALDTCEQALALHRAIGSRDGEAYTHDTLGYIHQHLGAASQAIASYELAVRLFRELGDRLGEAGTLTRLGNTHDSAANPRAARGAWRQALDILVQLDHPDAGEVRAKLAPTG